MELLPDKVGLRDRFIDYAKIWSTSDTTVEPSSRPSAEREWDIQNRIKEDALKYTSDVDLDESGHLIVRLASNSKKNKTPIAFMAHSDTNDAVTGENVNPQVVENYDGKDIKLPNGDSIPADHVLQSKKGQTIITTDGKTLLGGDDKAGSAILLGILKHLSENPSEPHGEVEFVFSRDEETGHGMDYFPIKKLHSKVLYTIDGTTEPLINTQSYHAYAVDVKFRGVDIHPGSARGIMVNALTMMTEFSSMFGRNNSPEATDGEYACYWPDTMEGDSSRASMSIMVRAFVEQEALNWIEMFKTIASAVEQSVGGKISISSSKIYSNVNTGQKKNPDVLGLLKKAAEQSGITPIYEAIRGGTDGSKLTDKGFMSANFFHGGGNFHSTHEWISLEGMQRSAAIGVNLAHLWAEK